MTATELLDALEAKARVLDRHADDATSTFFEAVYRAQSSILREFASEATVVPRSRAAGQRPIGPT